MTTSRLEHDLQRAFSDLSPEEAARHANLQARYAPHFDRISSRLYEKLDEPDRERFLIWFGKRWAGIGRIPNDEFVAYKAAVDRVKSHPYAHQVVDGREYKRLDLAIQGFSGELLTYPWMLGIHDFYFDQYQHGDFRIRPGDTIIDAGAFVGDTALLFATATGKDCRVHAFEVLEENLALLKHNLATNGIADVVRVDSRALGTRSGDIVHIKAPLVQGATSIFGTPDDAPVKTISIDDYVSEQDIVRVDLIKMDIEGAERLALAGALETIRRDRPRLAVCVYHLWDDVVEIPALIDRSGIAYRYAFKWVELFNGWEAVLLATPLGDA